MSDDFQSSAFPERRTPEERRAATPESWHFKKEISVSIIISVITLGIAVVVAYTDLQRDIALIQANIITLNQQDVRLKAEIDAASNTTSARFDRIDAKLDRLIERSVK